MFYIGADWQGDTICLHFRSENGGEYRDVVLNPHDAVEFELAFDTWMTRNKERLLDAMRRTETRRKDIGN